MCSAAIRGLKRRKLALAPAHHLRASKILIFYSGFSKKKCIIRNINFLSKEKLNRRKNIYNLYNRNYRIVSYTRFFKGSALFSLTCSTENQDFQGSPAQNQCLKTVGRPCDLGYMARVSGTARSSGQLH